MKIFCYTFVHNELKGFLCAYVDPLILFFFILTCNIFLDFRAHPFGSFMYYLSIATEYMSTSFLLIVLVVYSEFQLIHELCLYVLSASQRAELIRATLATLHAFLSWIPLGYIFESPLVCTIFLHC